jgi:hypothetical protein
MSSVGKMCGTIGFSAMLSNRKTNNILSQEKDTDL